MSEEKKMLFHSTIGYSSYWEISRRESETCDNCNNEGPCVSIGVNEEYGCTICFACLRCDQ